MREKLAFLLISGGNCNNGLHVGVSCVNLNNLFSNANWNIGPSHTYCILYILFFNAHTYPKPQAFEIMLLRLDESLTVEINRS